MARRRQSPARSRRRSGQFVVEGLEGRRLLSVNVAVASDVGQSSDSRVRLVDAETGAEQASVMAFESTFKGGVRLAMGHVTGNTAPDVVAGCGPGRVAEVKVFQPVTSGGTTTLTPVLTFRPFGDLYKGGIEVAVGDVDGDTVDDIMVSKSREGGDVKVFRTIPSATPGGNPTVDVAHPYATIAKPFGASYNGGSSVAAADVGTFAAGVLTSATQVDNKVEILVGSGVGIAPEVRVYDISLPSAPRVADTIVPPLYAAFGRPFLGGVSVTSGRYAASGVAASIDDIVVSAGRGGGGQTFVYDGTVSASANTLLKSFATYGTSQRPNAAVFAAAVDVDGNHQIDRFLVTQGDPGGPAGISNVSLAGVRSATAVTTLAGPLRIAAVRNSTARIGGTSTGAMTAGVGTMTAGGTLTVTDLDAGQAKFATPATSALTGTYGTFTFNTTTGAWTYALDTSRPATLLLRAPTVVTDSLAVTSIDGTASKTIQVSITGFTLQTTTGVTRVASGGIPVGTTRNMQYADIVAGTGATAANGDKLDVRYKGILLNGTVFDSGTLPNPPSFPVFQLGAGQVIAGWDYGLVGMKVGGERLLVIPPELAYGDAGAPPSIPSGATLVFWVKLNGVTA